MRHEVQEKEGARARSEGDVRALRVELQALAHRTLKRESRQGFSFERSALRRGLLVSISLLK